MLQIGPFFVLKSILGGGKVIDWTTHSLTLFKKSVVILEKTEHVI